MNKQKIRTYYKELRKNMDSADAEAKGREICKNFIESEFYANARTVMVYMPIQNEADTSALLEHIFKSEKLALVPVTEGGIMRAVRIDENTVFKTGQFGISEPCNIEYADSREIDLVAVPGIAFDARGGRIGFGKGFYDRFLAGTNAVRAALCYDFQLVGNAYADKHDAAVDYIVTESGITEVKI